MDELQQPEDTESADVGTDEVIIELLKELVQQGRDRRAESVMSPAPEAPPPPPEGGDDAQMAELEAMLAEAPPAAEGAPPPKKPEDEEETE